MKLMKNDAELLNKFSSDIFSTVIFGCHLKEFETRDLNSGKQLLDHF